MNITSKTPEEVNFEKNYNKSVPVFINNTPCKIGESKIVLETDSKIPFMETTIYPEFEHLFKLEVYGNIVKSNGNVIEKLELSSVSICLK